MRPLPLLSLCLLACGLPPAVELTPMPQATPAPVTHADGRLGTWERVRPLPVARANHCAAAVGDRLLVAGGNYRPAGAADFVTLDDVWTATVAADGTLGAWQNAGKLPSAGVECVLATFGRTVVLVGGLFADAAQSDRVWVATLQEDGTLSAWQSVGATPYGRRPLTAGAAFDGQSLFLTDSKMASEGQAQAVLARATLSNTLSDWSLTPYAQDFRGKPLGAFTSEAAFVIGGYAGSNEVLEEVAVLPLSGAAPSTTAPLPEARTFGAATYADGFLFVLGGRTQVLGVAPLPVTYSARVSGLTAGDWAPQASLPEPRSNHTATVVGDWLFVMGGGNNGPGLDTVFRARVKHLVEQ